MHPEAVALAVAVASLYTPPSGVNGNLDDPSSQAPEERRDDESETTFVNQEPYGADRKEARLVKAFTDYLTSRERSRSRG
ncbi:hypothetical protein [Streptomyces anthocyanicus]|uniref:hypothetical protein n=1 Tax=Streptomyces anthocyanicus TaxID=68174 RepID=UPI0022431FB7|nr:hypothetical protein [Streptomyces anthocyanicus]MCW8116819.1 hypothetical protein [Streptomyces anthocyanicus]